MTTERKEVSIARRLSVFAVAFFQAMASFGHQQHDRYGFGVKFVVMGALTFAWVYLWRAVVRRLRWRPVTSCVIPGVLFVLPLAALHWKDSSLGSERGDLLAAILIVSAIGVAMAVQTISIKPRQLLWYLGTGMLLTVSAFSPRFPGFGLRFFTLGLLVVVWIFVWRSVVERYSWRRAASFVIPPALFVLPLLVVGFLGDANLGNVPNTLFFAVATLGVIGITCAQREWR